MSCLLVLLGNAARVVYCSITTSVLRLGSAHFGSLWLCSARHGETPLEGGCLPSDALPMSQYIYFHWLHITGVTYCDVDGATRSRGHVNSAFPRVTSCTPTPIIMQRSVNTLPREAVMSRNRQARAMTIARQLVNTVSRNIGVRAAPVARQCVGKKHLTTIPDICCRAAGCSLCCPCRA
jgi:hypothetical protein